MDRGTFVLLPLCRTVPLIIEHDLFNVRYSHSWKVTSDLNSTYGLRCVSCAILFVKNNFELIFCPCHGQQMGHWPRRAQCFDTINDLRKIRFPQSYPLSLTLTTKEMCCQSNRSLFTSSKELIFLEKSPHFLSA